MKLKINYLPVSEITTYANNAKIHTAEQIGQIKESIKMFGFNDPVAVWGENNELVEGHGRLIAACELGMDKIPAIRLDELSDTDRRAYMLIHNKLTMDTGFDFDLMSMEAESLSFDLEIFGFHLSDEFNESGFENEEYDVEEFGDERFQYECQNCGFRFNA